MTNERAHQYARKQGYSRWIYALAYSISLTFSKLYFRLSFSNADRIPAEGAAIIVPNHKSFWDSFFVGLASSKRPVRYMAKNELFESKPIQAYFMSRLGSFPVRRGEADADALKTAKTILKDGGVLALFPEGTRVRYPDKLGTPKRGAARLALEMNVPMIPAAITGTERLFVGPFLRPTKVRVSFGEPIYPSDIPATIEGAKRLTDEIIWPEIERQFHSLRSRKGLIAAAISALGLGAAGAGIAISKHQKAQQKSKLHLPKLHKGKKKRKH